jgi:hypothetical protein
MGLPKYKMGLPKCKMEMSKCKMGLPKLKKGMPKNQPLLASIQLFLVHGNPTHATRKISSSLS